MDPLIPGLADQMAEFCPLMGEHRGCTGKPPLGLDRQNIDSILLKVNGRTKLKVRTIPFDNVPPVP
jgi:hypothetical protein